MKNNRGQTQMPLMVGGAILAFVATIVALAIYTGGITANVGQVTLTEDLVNTTVAAPVVNSTVAIPGQGFSGTVTVFNGTSGTDISAFFDIKSRQVLNGVVTGTLTTLDTGSDFVGENLLLSYTSEPEGYAGDAAARGLTVLIAIFAALAIALVTLEFALRSMGQSGIMGMMSGSFR